MKKINLRMIHFLLSITKKERDFLLTKIIRNEILSNKVRG